jgi:hypothetical protein
MRGFQHRRHSPRILHLSPARHVPGLAHRHLFIRLRNRSEAFPIPTRLTSSTRHHLYFLRLCPRQHHVAAHCGGGGIDDCARSGERQREERGGDHGHDIGLVRVWIAGRGDARIAGDDSEYSVIGPVDG